MKTVKYRILCLVLIAGMIALGGCKGKKADEGAGAEAKPDQSIPAVETQADETVPVSEVKAEADKMDASRLRAAALTYKEAIVARKAELENVAAQLKEIPVTELLGEKAKQLKTQIDSLTQSVAALKTRFDVFYARLKEANGDLSGLP